MGEGFARPKALERQRAGTDNTGKALPQIVVRSPLGFKLYLNHLILLIKGIQSSFAMKYYAATLYEVSMKN